eukprot:544976_1
MSVKASGFLSRWKWSTCVGITSLFSYSVVVIEPQTGVKFEDEYNITVYPGLKKRFPHSLTRLSYSLPKLQWSISYLKQKYMSKQLVMGEYVSNSVNLYRMVLLDTYSGTDLMNLIKEEMLKYSRNSKYETDVDCTRTGSLFFVALGKLKCNKGDEIIFLCNRETNNFTIWLTTQDATEWAMHFTIESELLVDCINYAFGDKDTAIFETTYNVQ